MAAVHIAAVAAAFVLIGLAADAANPGYHLIDRIAGPDGNRTVELGAFERLVVGQ